MKPKVFSYTDKAQPEVITTVACGYPGSVRERLSVTEFTTLNPTSLENPNFGTIYIEYVPNKLAAEQESLRLYFTSFRMVSMPFADIPAHICEDLWKILQPSVLYVKGDFIAPGGSQVSIDTYKSTEPQQPAPKPQ